MSGSAVHYNEHTILHKLYIYIYMYIVYIVEDNFRNGKLE